MAVPRKNEIALSCLHFLRIKSLSQDILIQVNSVGGMSEHAYGY